MLKIISLSAILLNFSVSAVMAQDEPVESLDNWALTQTRLIGQDCSMIDRKEWIKRYREMSIEVLGKMQGMNFEKYEGYAADGPFRLLISSVFPQHVPFSAKKKRAPNMCFPNLWDFLNAKSAEKVDFAVSRFESCNLDRYANDLPEPVSRVIQCWKDLKK